MSNEQEVREQLASYAHEAWSGWMRYLFEKSVKYSDNSVHIERGLVERWQRQMNTPYGSLPENEKESDRAEADKILAITGLTWTSEKPTEPGVYWMDNATLSAVHVLVWENPNTHQLWVEWAGDDYRLGGSRFENNWFRWAGPIPEPTEPKP